MLLAVFLAFTFNFLHYFYHIPFRMIKNNKIKLSLPSVFISMEIKLHDTESTILRKKLNKAKYVLKNIGTSISRKME